jgi:hypothetical protein
MKKALFLALLGLVPVFSSPTLSAQDSRRLSVELRFGLNMNLTNFNPFGGKNQKFAGIRVFGSAIILGDISPNLKTNYGATIAIYNKSLGNNMNPLVSDIQVDFINTLSLGVGWGGMQGSPFRSDFWEGQPRVGYTKYLRTMNQAPFFNLKHDFHSAVFLSSNFIVNNHRRNQTCGSISMTFGDFSLNYYNDGSFPFSTLSLSDGFDRYWTGGLLLMGHNNQGYNSFELSFDQFTGYRPLVYEFSNLFGMNVPEYDGSKGNGNGREIGSTHRDRFSSSSYNSSAYNLKIYLDPNYAVDFGVIGSLMKNERHYGLQDIIHINGRMSMHPNRDINRFYFGITYNQFGYEY